MDKRFEWAGDSRGLEEKGDPPFAVSAIVAAEDMRGLSTSIPKRFNLLGPNALAEKKARGSVVLGLSNAAAVGQFLGRRCCGVAVNVRSAQLVKTELEDGQKAVIDGDRPPFRIADREAICLKRNDPLDVAREKAPKFDGRRWILVGSAGG